MHTDYLTTGDWAVGKPKTYPVQWESDRILAKSFKKILE
jgi:hypothetical protein